MRHRMRGGGGETTDKRREKVRREERTEKGEKGGRESEWARRILGAARGEERTDLRETEAEKVGTNREVETKKREWM